MESAVSTREPCKPAFYLLAGHTEGRGWTGRRIANQTGEEQALHMSTVEQITGAVKRLPKKDFAQFRKWFAEYDAAVWDRQPEQDAAAGRLDVLAREALREHHAARTRER